MTYPSGRESGMSEVTVGCTKGVDTVMTVTCRAVGNFQKQQNETVRNTEFVQ